MHDFSAREMPPGAVHFSGVANGGSFARLKPRTLAATAMKTAAADRIGCNAPAAQIPTRLRWLQTAGRVLPVQEDWPKRPLVPNGTSIVVNC